jgi:tetratricopeptide (TPR) repeat protein
MEQVRVASLARVVAFALAVVSGLLLLVGCAGVGIVASSDPLTKLNDAEDLFMRQDRPLPAERLIREAIAIYQERDDAHGLGNAYREYGDLLRSPSVVGKWQKFYRENGFQDKTVTLDNRIAKSSEYYAKALGYYGRAEQKHREAGEYDRLTNTYYNMAWSHSMLDERDKACGYYDKTLEAYQENIRRNPTAKPYVPSGVGSVPDLIASVRRQAGC